MPGSIQKSAQISAETSPQAAAQDKPHDATFRKWWILIAVGIVLFLASLDGSIVNVALPTLMNDFDATFPTVQWVVLSYLLGLTVLLVSMGRLADMLGKKRVFASGIVLFLLGSALCGLAPDVYWLIGFRFLQSIGAAMMLALGVAILTETWPPHERGQAIGFAAGFISLGIVFGPAIGGVMLQYMSWHWIFYVNVPIGAAAFVLVLVYVPPLRPAGRRESFDFGGAAALMVGLLCLTLAITMGQGIGFGAVLVVGLFVAGGLAIAAFVWIEMHVRFPMLDLTLFREVQFSLNLFTGALVFIALAGVVLLLPFYLQLVLHEPLQMVGLLMAVVPLSMAFVQPASGMLSDRMGTRQVSLVGLGFMLAGYLLMATLRVDGTPLGFVVRMLPVAIGMAMFNSPNNSAIMGSAPKNRLGVASAVLSMVRTLGQVTGIAVLGAFFYSRLAVYSGGTAGLEAAPPKAIVAALHDQFLLVAVLIAVAIAVSLWTWRWEIQHGRAGKTKALPTAPPVEA
jgi:EmrB/QacA subfamily drug resistance transporter